MTRVSSSPLTAGKSAAVMKILAFLLLVAVFFVPVCLVNLFRLSRVRGRMLRWFYALGAMFWSVRVERVGKPVEDGPALLVSNHCSYLDIPALGSLAAVRFTPKSDVRGWPLIGLLCRMSACLFIDRRRSGTQRNQRLLQSALEQGALLSVFPEGTTNDGREVLPFRSSYFSLAEERIQGKPLKIQPVTVVYLRPDGAPMDDALRERVAWYGDAEFVGHLWKYLQTCGVRARVIFHPPLTEQEADQNRKDLAKLCQRHVAESYIECLAQAAALLQEKRGVPKDALSI